MNTGITSEAKNTAAKLLQSEDNALSLGLDNRISIRII